MGYSENKQLTGSCREDGKLNLDSLLLYWKKERNAAKGHYLVLVPSNEFKCSGFKCCVNCELQLFAEMS